MTRTEQATAAVREHCTPETVAELKAALAAEQETIDKLKCAYLLADDRCSGGVRDEADMLGCSHCQRLMRQREWQCDGGFCHSCDAPVCSGCADRIPTKGCEVFLRVLEGELEREYRRSQNARLLGIDYT